MAKGLKELGKTAFHIVSRSSRTATTDDLAKIERAARGAEVWKESLTPARRSEIAKAAAARRWATQG